LKIYQVRTKFLYFQTDDLDLSFQEGKEGRRNRAAELTFSRFLSLFPFPLVSFAGYQSYDSAVNFTDWDTFFYTRTFPSMDNMRVFRHMTKVLTFPITIASVLFNLSPYMRSNGRLTKEGERSLSG